MLIKNQVYEATITDYTSEGQGVAKIEGCAVFVPNAIVGEKCQIRIEKVGKTWAAGKMVQILEKSPHRINRPAPWPSSAAAVTSTTWTMRRRAGSRPSGSGPV